MLAQGLLVGVGAGLLFLPTITIPPLWVRKERRTVVLGLVATGSSVGAILFSVVFEGMVGRVGFGWACRTIAFVTVPGNLFAVVVLRLPEQAVRKEGRALVDWSMAKEDVFRMLCASAFVVFVGLYIPVFFVQEYAAVKTDLGNEVVRYLVPVLMTGQTVGRVLPNVVAERIGTLNVSIGITVGCAVLAFAWVAVASSAAVVVWAVLYGFVSVVGMCRCCRRWWWPWHPIWRAWERGWGWQSGVGVLVCCLVPLLVVPCWPILAVMSDCSVGQVHR